MKKENYGVGFQISNQTEQENKPKSFLIVKTAQLGFYADMLKWATKWGKKNGYEMLVRNTPEGFYEIGGVDKEAI